MQPSGDPAGAVGGGGSGQAGSGRHLLSAGWAVPYQPLLPLPSHLCALPLPCLPTGTSAFAPLPEAAYPGAGSLLAPVRKMKAPRAMPLSPSPPPPNTHTLTYSWNGSPALAAGGGTSEAQLPHQGPQGRLTDSPPGLRPPPLLPCPAKGTKKRRRDSLCLSS